MHDSGQRLNNTAITNKQLSSNGMAVFLLKKLKHSINKKNCLITIILFACNLFQGSGIFISPKGVLLGTGSVGLCLVAWGVSAAISFGGKRNKLRFLTFKSD